MSLVRIADLGTVIRGVSWDKTEASDVSMPGYVPVLRAGNISDRLDTVNDLVWVPASNVSATQTLRVGDIAICMSSGSASVVGKTAISQAAWPGSVGAFCAILRADPTVCLPEYLAFYLKSPLFRAWTSEAQGANIKNIKKSALENFKIELPNKAEQRRIVDVLTRAESIVRLRREAQQKAAELVPAIFRQMFGDPEFNRRGLPMRKVSSFVDHFEGGKNIQAGSDDPNGYRILKVSAVTSGQYLERESKPAPNNHSPQPSHVVRAGDMLFSRANTVELVGATAVVEATNDNTLLPDKLWRFVWAEDVDVSYMHALFQDRSVRKMLGKLATGTSDSMRNISQAKLFDLALPVAPIAEQQRFGRFSEQARSIFSAQSLGLTRASETFDALMAQSFVA